MSEEISNDVDQLIDWSKKQLRGGVRPGGDYTDLRKIIACYTAAVMVNFTDWLGKTYPWARHELAQHALKDNLRCEQAEDHAGMLEHFARQASAFPGTTDFIHVSAHVGKVRKCLTDVSMAGLNGLVIMAVLENTSEIFIPVLERIGKKLGVTDLKYTQVHGVADAEHSAAFITALKAELTMGYCSTGSPYHLMLPSAECAINLIGRVFN